MQKKFQRKEEDFVCDNCGRKVRGNGYTDHCPFCLWGKHLDINPGDRQADCGGPMEPTGVEIRGSAIRIEYICQKCGYRYVVKAAKDDNTNKIIRLSAKVEGP